MHSEPVMLKDPVEYVSPSFNSTLEPKPGVGSNVMEWLAHSPSMAADLCCFSAALFLVVLHPPLSGSQDSVANILRMRISLQNLLFACICVAMWAAILRVSRKGTRTGRPATNLLFSTLWEILACMAVAGVVLLLRRPDLAKGENLLLFAGISTFLVVLLRVATGAYCARVQPAMRKQRTVLIVGAGWRGEKMNAELIEHPRWNYRSLGFIDTNPPDPTVPLLGSFDDLEDILMTTAVDEVIITLPIKSMYDQIQQTIEVCERVGVQSRYFTDLFATQITKRRSVDQYHPSSVLLHLVHDEQGRLRKRLIDIAVAGSGLLLLSPILVTIAIAIRLTSKGPILFRQQRYGLNKRLFTMFKFRSMVVDAEQQMAKLEHLNETGGATFKLSKDPRVTSIGHIIRKTSLDELPQLWNVLIGNMSLVGPRPLPMRDVSRFSEAWLMRRFSVAPGITGLWQVSGRSNITFTNWIELDLQYIDNWSLALDLKILAKTFPAVLKGEGAV